jgi:hypothetical protein
MGASIPEREKRPGQLMVQVIAALSVSRLRFRILGQVCVKQIKHLPIF